jgi:hypothetical protein
MYLVQAIVSAAKYTCFLLVVLCVLVLATVLKAE